MISWAWRELAKCGIRKRAESVLLGGCYGDRKAKEAKTWVQVNPHFCLAGPLAGETQLPYLQKQSKLDHFLGDSLFPSVKWAHFPVHKTHLEIAHLTVASNKIT